MELTDRDACVILNLLSGIGAAKLNALTSRFGSPREIFSQSKQNLMTTPGIGEALAAKLFSWQELVELEKELNMIERAGVKLITCCDSDYPEILRELNDYPLCLYVKGRLPNFSHNSIAIVGSRRISNYGRRMAEHLSQGAAYAGWVVNSGLAYGIDAIAHQACLDANGVTVAVLGGGLARIHPQEHLTLARDIAEKGAVITEFPMEFAPNKRTFPMRNRIVSGLSRAILVVEAGYNSGSLITANFALEQGRQVFAVPGCADTPHAKGCHALIKQGAKLTETFDDVIEEFEFLPGFREICHGKGRPDSDAAGEEEFNQNVNATLSDDEQLIFNALGAGEASLEQLQTETGLMTGQLLALLMQMEMKKLIRQLPGKKYRRKVE